MLSFTRFQNLKVAGWVALVLACFSVHFDAGTRIYAHTGSEDANCTPTDYHIHGQNHGLVGGADAISRPSLSSNDTVESIDPFVAEVEHTGFADEPVVILVVDDFQNPIYTRSHGWYVLQLLTNVITQFDIEKGVRSITLAPIDIGLNVLGSPESHYRTDIIDDRIRGAIETFQQAGFRRFVINMSFAVMPCHATVQVASDGTITLGQSNSGGGETEATEEAFDGVSFMFDFFDYLVLHQSYPSLSLMEYIQLLYDQNGELDEQLEMNTVDEMQTPIGREVLELMLQEGTVFGGAFDPALPSVSFAKSSHQPTSIDPLHELLLDLQAQTWASVPQESSGEEPPEFIVVPIGSAGNFAGNEPLAPARWDEVVSVSASSGDVLWAESDYGSNSGEIMLPGGWYEYGNQTWHIGTSYSAPVASTLIALYLTHPVVPCNFEVDRTPFSFPGYDNLNFEEAAVGSGCAYSP